MCIETKSKNGKRLMRRVRVVNKAEHLEPYLLRVCQVLGCCSELVSATRYPMGHCNQTSCVKGQGNNVLLALSSQWSRKKDKRQPGFGSNNPARAITFYPAVFFQQNCSDFIVLFLFLCFFFFKTTSP